MSDCFVLSLLFQCISEFSIMSIAFFSYNPRVINLKKTIKKPPKKTKKMEAEGVLWASLSEAEKVDALAFVPPVFDQSMARHFRQCVARHAAEKAEAFVLGKRQGIKHFCIIGKRFSN